MNPDDIKIENVSKLFEYEKISREIDSCTNLDLMKNLCKCYVKLYFGLEEYMQSIDIFSPE